ncbi:NUDIX hydrolase [Vreelandella malpeensis]|uniref:NUDIX domain-containing protein n=1 Tax=Vreelandella malpeensis TaxID=1172368 RepID=A0ABS8DXG6_9GAMM|nr:NUDIX domain-containing protein [Halomonas malpeensis]MCB8890685.1 NUDIX domain-containing protein [Halomonas malpeensis]
MALTSELPQQTLRIAAAIVENVKGELLLVRKRGTRYFMQPGGKIEPGEPVREALTREIEEELGVRVAPSRLAYVTRVEIEAANEANTLIDAELYRLVLDERVEAAAEIAETIWVAPRQALALELAPLTREHVLPLAFD